MKLKVKSSGSKRTNTNADLAQNTNTTPQSIKIVLESIQRNKRENKTELKPELK